MKPITKYERLLEILRQTEHLAVAYSGGVDSTLLLYAAKQALGDRTAALTAVSAFFPEREQTEAVSFCRDNGIRQILIDFDVLSVEGVRQNPSDRCYLCKRTLFGKFLETAGTFEKDAVSQENPGNGAEPGGQESDAACGKRCAWAVAEGSNLDDLQDDRPGMRAIEELRILSPLRDAGMTKADIRELSRQFGLPTWDKPSFACLASRFVFGETITEEKLRMVERAEELLRSLGFSQFRVRIHGNGRDGKNPGMQPPMARIEVLPEQFPLLIREEVRKNVTKTLRSIGFSYVTMDLDGYRTGSMNVRS